MAEGDAHLIDRVKLRRIDGAVVNPATSEDIAALGQALVEVGSPVWERGSASGVVSGVETIVLVHTVAGSPLFLDNVRITGQWAAEFRVYLNTLLKETKRIEVTDPSPDIPFYGLRLEVGDVLEVRVVHYHAGATHQFESTLRGRR